MIYLLDVDKEICDAWTDCFENIDNIKIINEDFKIFMDTHKDINCVATPGNSLGIMSGGFDLAVRNYFGKECEDKVKQVIKTKHSGLLQPGITEPVKINDKIVLFYTPSMILPEKIIDHRIIFFCMRSVMEYIKISDNCNIVIPAFGSLTGGIDAHTVARMMFLGYVDIMERDHPMTRFDPFYRLKD